MTSENNSTEIKEAGFGLDWNKVNTWDWPEIVEPLSINISKYDLVAFFVNIVIG